MAGNSGNIDPKKYNEALNSIKAMEDSAKRVNKTLSAQMSLVDGISKLIFKTSGSSWFTEKAKSMQDLASDYEQISKIEAKLKTAGDSLNNMFKNSNLSNAAKSLKKISDITNVIVSKDLAASFEIPDTEENRKQFKKLTEQIQIAAKDGKGFQETFESLTDDFKNNEKLLKEMDKLYKSEVLYSKQLKKLQIDKNGALNFLNNVEDEYLKNKILEAIQEDNISGLLNKQGIEAAMILYNSGQLTETQKEQIELYLEASKSAKGLKNELSKITETVFDWKRGLKEFGMNLLRDIIPGIKEFDKVISEAQRDTGVMFKENSLEMTNLVSQTAIYGMGIKENVKLMSEMSDVLNTTNFSLLFSAAKDLADIQLATGMSSESLATMSAEMMRMGESSSDVRQNIIEINQTAKMFGVNSKKALESISKNFVRFRTMGFQGGIESLKKMTAMSLRLGQNIDEVFDMSDKARTIEGAIDMAAELQLASGSFSNISPMDLLSSARKGPQELQKLLGQMGKDIGKFDEKTGEMTFDAVDVDRLKIVANATGETLEGIQNRITKMNQDNKKLNLMPELKFDGITDQNGKEIDPEGIKALLSDSVDMTGKVLEGSFLDKKGIKDLSKLSQEDMQKMIKEKALEDANLEKQAKQNQSLEASMTAFKDAFVNLFTILQPAIETLTGIIQFLSSVLSTSGGKFIILASAIGLFVAQAVPAMIALSGNIAGKFGKFTDLFSKGEGGMASQIKEKFIRGKSGGQTPLSSTADLAKSSETIKPKSGSGLKDFLTNLGEGLSKFGSKAIDILKGAATLAGATILLGSSLGILALLFSNVDPILLLAFGGAIVELAGAFWLASMAAKNIRMKDMLTLSLSILVMGAAMIPLAGALSIMEGISWETMAKAGVAILSIIGVLIGLGAIMTTGIGAVLIGGGIIALLGVAISLTAVGAAFIIFASGMNSLSSVNWTAFEGMSSALLSMSAGLMAFSLAGLMFLNPITMAGMWLMVGVLGAISLVLAPLAESLDMGSKGLDGMAAGVMKLSDSLQKLDFEKLDKLKEFSEGMVEAASGGAVAESLGKLAEALGSVGGKSSGGGAGTESRPIIIQLKMPSGLVIEEHIIKSLDKVS